MSNYSFERKVALYTRIREPMGDTHFTNYHWGKTVYY